MQGSCSIYNLCWSNCIWPSLHCPTNDPFCNQAEIMLLKSGRYSCFHAGLFLGPRCTDIANGNKLLWVMCSGLVMWSSYLLERELRHQQRAKEWTKEKSQAKWNEAISSSRLLATDLSFLASGSHLIYLMGDDMQSFGSKPLTNKEMSPKAEDKDDRVGINCISRGGKSMFYCMFSHSFLGVNLAAILIALLRGTFQFEDTWQK